MASSVHEKLFKCLKLFQVEESSPVAGGETPFNSIDVVPQSSASTSVTHCCYKETRNYSVLVLVCDNGYLVIRLELFLRPPTIKQLKWYEGRDQHILDITFDPLGEWLACACLDGNVYLVPVLTLMIPDCFPTHIFGPLDDIRIATPTRKVSPPTSIVWWESIDGGQICIVGSELGEITLFNLHEGKEIAFLSMRGCIDQLMLAKKSDYTTHLLINLRGGEWWWMLLEERYHEANGTSYSDVQASGFEVVYDDAVLRSFLSKQDGTAFEPKLFQDFSELTRLFTQQWDEQEMLGALNLQNHQFELFTYNFDMNSGPLRTFKVPPNTTSVLSTERLLYTVNHNDESDELSFTLSIISTELAQRNVYELPANALIQKFTLPSESTIVGFYPSTLESADLANESRDLTTPTNLGGCVIVTSNAVYQCKQIRSPESVFLGVALSTRNYHMTDEIALTYKLDVCELYQIAGKEQIKKLEYRKALKLFEQSKCPSREVMENFVHMERIPELVSYLLDVVCDDTGDVPVTNPKLLQDVLLQCLIHQCLESSDPAEVSAWKERLSQFINDKFQYNHTVAMEMLLRCGMKAQLFEIALAHRKIPESVDMLANFGSTELDPPIQAAIATGQFAPTLSTNADGLVLHQLSPANLVKCIIAKPSLLEKHLSYLVSVLPKLDLMILVRLSWILDPSHQIIQPLLHEAHSSLKRSNSTGSIMSLASIESGPSSHIGTEFSPEDSGPSLESYIEAFILTLMTLNYKRTLLPAPSTGLLALSPIIEKLGDTPQDKALKPLTTFSDGSVVLHGNILSCGLNHAGLVVSGDLYTWGSTHSGKLGHGDIEQQPVAAPLKVETLSMLNIKVFAVSCGAEHTIALCQEGIFSWGLSTHGQLGLGDTLKRTRPVQIASLTNVTMVTIVCGQYHCLALDEEHRVWSWGWGAHGQTGVGVTNDLLIPTHSKVLDELSVSYLSAGFNHSAVITTNGKLYTFGNGMYGQLGHGDQEKQTTPKLVKTLSDKFVYLVECGNSHTLAVCKDQSVYHWGKNFHKPYPGNSPQSLRQYTRSRKDGATSPAVLNSLQPVLMPDLNLDDVIIQVGCGNYHCVILTASGTVYSWGNNIHGQIGHTHIPELSQPKRVSKLETHHIKNLSCGDEFSIALDDNGISWVWGRDELGQLGMEFPQGMKEGRKVCIFAPNPNPQIPRVVPHGQQPKFNIVSQEQSEDSLLGLDLQWDIPDFANIGSSTVSYGRDSLNTALESLHGFYRTGTILCYCTHLKDYKSMAVIMKTEKQWPQVLQWKLVDLSSDQEMINITKVLPIVQETLENHLSETTDHHSRHFIITTAQMLSQLLQFWTDYSLKLSTLEEVLSQHMTALAYPLSVVLKNSKSQFSFKFSLAVTMEMAKQITAGVPPLQKLMKVRDSQLNETVESCDTELQDLDSSSSSSIETTQGKIETSPNDSRLWIEVLRNLTKDLSRHSNITVPENSLSSIRNYRQKVALQQDLPAKKDNIVIFSCGHSFSENQFLDKTLMEFQERVNDFPTPIPNTKSYIHGYYKHSPVYSIACPYCVFQFLRKAQLEKVPGVPIRPWNH